MGIGLDLGQRPQEFIEILRKSRRLRQLLHVLIELGINSARGEILSNSGKGYFYIDAYVKRRFP